MVVIGLTGGIGTGKSTVSRVLAGLGAVIIDAALVGHEVYKPTNPAWKSLTSIFGSDILLSDNQVDRQKLGNIVFNDPAAMAKLNAIMRPEIRNVLIERLEKEAEIEAARRAKARFSGYRGKAGPVQYAKRTRTGKAPVGSNPGPYK